MLVCLHLNCSPEQADLQNFQECGHTSERVRLDCFDQVVCEVPGKGIGVKERERDRVALVKLPVAHQKVFTYRALTIVFSTDELLLIWQISRFGISTRPRASNVISLRRVAGNKLLWSASSCWARQRLYEKMRNNMKATTNVIGRIATIGLSSLLLISSLVSTGNWFMVLAKLGSELPSFVLITRLAVIDRLFQLFWLFLPYAFLS